jgi:zeta-carotene desaturase
VRSVIIVGGGLAGLSAAAALGQSGYQVQLLEARPYLGGRATSYELPGGDGPIDNCQHILLGCCRNLLDFYKRLGVESQIRFWHKYHFIEPGGRLSTLESNDLPAPFHFAASFPKLKFLSAADKLSIARGLFAIRREYGRRADLHRITMAHWLAEKRQTARAVDRFWRPVLVSAVNEEPEAMAAVHGLQVFRLGFLSSAADSAMGVPAVPLGELYAAEAWARIPNVAIRTGAPVVRVDGNGVHLSAESLTADAVILAVPFEKAVQIAPGLGLNFSSWDHSPITGIHLWFTHPVTALPHAALLDRTIQWFFARDGGRYLQLVVSASRSLTTTSRDEVFEMARTELAEFLPEAREARLEKMHVVKEIRATFSAAPGLARPGAATSIPGVFLAGDYTETGWPATMEGAVRSGYIAAREVCRAAGDERNFLIPDHVSHTIQV